MVYIHKEDTHNLNAPRSIVSVIKKLLPVRSVVDVGCGVGTFLYAFKEVGVTEVTGIDGKWVNAKLLTKYLEKREFIEADLSHFIDLNRKYDLALCLEVAEHIVESNSDNLIKTLVNLSDLILFSAAIPYQLGQYHVNEQWPSYWQQKFSKHGYLLLDNIRMKFWDNEMGEFWYKQNLFFVVKNSSICNYDFLSSSQTNALLNVVHPDLYTIKAALVHDIENGRKELGYYCKLLLKSLLIKVKIIKR